MFNKFKYVHFKLYYSLPYLELIVLHQLPSWMTGSLAPLLGVAFPF